ncbi:MAG: hypothetical protein V2I26_14950 [Halieaceae bacterium]|jgi:hypothetical protein|nr:hypothetical protein [Halieaceae bacterium]
MPEQVLDMDIRISPRNVLRYLLAMIALLLLANCLGIAWFMVFPPKVQMPLLVNLFNFNLEANVPTLYSACQLVLTSLLLLSVGVARRKRQQGCIAWKLLAFIFLFLAIDEASSIHEQLTVVTRQALGTSGYLFFAWVIPYGIATLLLLLLFAKFLIDLPPRTRMLFLFSAAIFLGGTLGLEMLGGRYVTSPGATELTYSVIYTLEEVLEMVGIALFIYAILDYMTTTFSRMSYVVTA